jgi:hypothetical protein
MIMRSIWFSPENFSNVAELRANSGEGDGMSSGFLQGVSFFALMVVVVTAVFGGFGVL